MKTNTIESAKYTNPPIITRTITVIIPFPKDIFLISKYIRKPISTNGIQLPGYLIKQIGDLHITAYKIGRSMKRWRTQS